MLISKVSVWNIDIIKELEDKQASREPFVNSSNSADEEVDNQFQEDTPDDQSQDQLKTFQ